MKGSWKQGPFFIDKIQINGKIAQMGTPGRKRREPTAAEIEEILELASDNKTERTIKGIHKIGHCTWDRCKKEIGKIVTAIKKGHEHVVEDVERAMHKAAIGHKYTEIRIDRRDGKEWITETTREIQPNILAGIFLLKNEKPAQYKDKQDIEIGGTMKVLRIPDIQKPKGAGESTHIDNGN